MLRPSDQGQRVDRLRTIHDGQCVFEGPMSSNGEGGQISQAEAPDYKVLQRPDLRWHFQIDGKLSDKTYPTAGEAQRGAEAFILATRRTPVSIPWQWFMLLAAAAVPAIYVLMLLKRLVGF